MWLENEPTPAPARNSHHSNQYLCATQNPQLEITYYWNQDSCGTRQQNERQQLPLPRGAAPTPHHFSPRIATSSAVAKLAANPWPGLIPRDNRSTRKMP